jgi:predicted ATPase
VRASGAGSAIDRCARFSGLPDDELQAALSGLVGSGLVFETGTPPDAVYTFKHALVQDVAYRSLLRTTRRQLHGRIAEALEALSPELIDSQPELFARHCVEAGLVEKSVFYWSKAGHRSAARSAMAEAAAQLQKALDQLALLPDTAQRRRQELELSSTLGAVLSAVKGFAASETGGAYACARKSWERLGSPAEFLQVPYGLARYHMHRGELDLALRVDGDLLRLSRQRGDSGGLVLGYFSSGRNLMRSGRFASSRSHLEEALALYDPISHRALVHQIGFHPQVISQAVLGNVFLCLGYPDQALARSNAAIADARSLSHPPSFAVSLALSTELLSLVGDNAALDERAGELVAVATEQGFPHWHSLGAIYRGYAKVKNGDVADGMLLLRNGARAYRATGAELGLPFYLHLVATACEAAGQVEEGLAQLDEALLIVERTGERWFAAELNRHKGQLRLRQGNPGAAEELYRKALRIAREQEAGLWELRAATSLARLSCDQDRDDKARDLLTSVYGRFTEGLATADLQAAKTLLDELQ